MTLSAFVRDVDEHDFEDAVIERSRQVPVVVDFWAPWCGPCRLLGPILESLVGAYGGRIELAKVNTDENPNIAARYRIEGIPAVKAFRAGTLSSEFTGALPEPQVRAFLQKLLPSEADDLADTAVRQAYAGDTAGAEATYRRAIVQDGGNRAANLGLARLLLARDEEDEALRLLANLPGDAEATRLRAEIGLRRSCNQADINELRQRLGRDPADVDALFALGMALAAQGAYEEALERLLDVVRCDRTYENDAGRRAILDIFALLGDADPLTQTYRRRLSYLLF
ncbi:MAG TPA: tetratricopeptide repeat protein [Dehalococcoidia bacterium]|nr:tetratricopeptide repeat protein [Dehalococcoidia bacterium]